MKKYFMPRQEAAKLSWFKNFANKLAGYAAKYNISAAEITDMTLSVVFYEYWYNYSSQYIEYTRKLTQYKTELREGIPAGATASVPPTPPTFGPVPTAVLPGMFSRASALAVIIKKRSNYTEADGLDLGIEGSEDVSAFTKGTGIKPSILVQKVQGGKPEIVWQKLDSDGIDIWVDRGNGTFAFLATDTYPNYIDNSPLPISGAEVWKYKAIYRYGDDQIGNWSDIISTAVGA
jgi:hypothetical protein